MLGQLSPEQAYELTLYHAMEPFGEVRADIRIAQLIEFYYASQGGNKKRKAYLSDFVMYTDIREWNRQHRSATELAAQLDKLAGSNHG